MYWHHFSHHFDFFCSIQATIWKLQNFLYRMLVCDSKMSKTIFLWFFAIYSWHWRTRKVGTRLAPKTITFHTHEKPPEIYSTMCTLGWMWTKNVGIRCDTISMAHGIAVFIKHSCTVEYRTLLQAAFVCGCVLQNGKSPFRISSTFNVGPNLPI